ncbi:hypothetical protein Gpo141_00012981 [Globisporangium polare]
MSDELPSPSPSRKRPRPASAFDQQAHAVSDQSGERLAVIKLRCCYRSKQCDNERALKLNGEHHKLCEYHRQRANLNQQRVHQRRKLRMKQSERLASLTSSAASSPRTSETDGMGTATGAFPAVDSSSHCASNSECVWVIPEPFDSPCGDLPVYDLVILETLLFSSSPPSSPRWAYSQSSPTVSIRYADGVKREL